MKKTMLLLLAALLSQAAHAQTTTPQTPKGQQPSQRPAASPNLEDDPNYQRLTPEAQAQVAQTMERIDTAIKTQDLGALERLKLEFAKRDVAGVKFCGGHTADDATKLDAFEHNGTHYAYAVRWLDAQPGRMAHSAIFANAGRCVAIDGFVTRDGHVVAAVMPNSLAVSAKHGLVAYEAEYWLGQSDRAAGNPTGRGIFIEDRFLAPVNPEKASAPFQLNINTLDPDFHWNDADETLVLKPGVALPLATFTPLPQAPTAPKPAAMQPAQSGCGDSKLSQARKILGGILPGGTGKVLQKVQPCPASPIDGQGAKN